MMDNCPLIRSDHLRYQNDNMFIRQNGSSRLSGSSSLSLTESGSSSTNGGRTTIPQFHINRNPTRNSNNNNNHPRISLFKALTRRRTESSSSKNGSKHKKLDEDWLNGNDEPVLHGVTFSVKFLGSALTDKAGGADALEATRTVIQMVKGGKKTCRVGMTVSPSGIVLTEQGSGEVISQISVYDIAHCSLDATYPTIFSFIATNKNETNECYCFACDKRKMAQKATLTIAEAFNLAYEIWRNSTSSSKSNQVEKVKEAECEDVREDAWVHFDDDDDESQLDLLEGRGSRRRMASLNDHEDLLICLQ